MAASSFPFREFISPKKEKASNEKRNRFRRSSNGTRLDVDNEHGDDSASSYDDDNGSPQKFRKQPRRSATPVDYKGEDSDEDGDDLSKKPSKKTVCIYMELIVILFISHLVLYYSASC